MVRQPEGSIATILFGVVISCFIGFYNKYPLVFPDTGTYLASGFSGEVPIDRTLFYGLFARHISLSASPWLIIVAQSVLISWLLYTTFGLFFTGIKRNLYFLTTLAFLVLTTGYSYTVSILIPDIFSSIALLCVLNLVVNPNLSRLSTVLIGVVFVFSLSTHLSNLSTFLGLLAFFLVSSLVQRWRKKDTWVNIRRLLVPLCLTLFAFLLVPSVHYLFQSRFQYSAGSHVFMVNHLNDIGVLDQYLDENCTQASLNICAYKDDLGWDFMWSSESALYKTGGWIANKAEYNRILYDVYSDPTYWPLLIQKTIEYTCKQFFTFHTNVFPPQLFGSAPYGQINWRFHDSVREYLSARQSNNLLQVTTLNEVETWVILASMVILFAMLVYSQMRSKLCTEFIGIVRIVWAYSVVNAFVCANLSAVSARFQNRWIWLLPMLAIIGVSMLLRAYKQSTRLLKET